MSVYKTMHDAACKFATMYYNQVTLEDKFGVCKPDQSPDTSPAEQKKPASRPYRGKSFPAPH